ncbi:kinase-like domain-containing protein [Aspergillus novoparasiticus]|uniref:Kinase-like domain-containing protein n=1 Tax=Aspergillus novoparasiticus TaxID=986946 RepID=A0A5N6EU64_9EURO|nr:kinase-like domain-containing protein [Aspergillus novoparasiticus]
MGGCFIPSILRPEFTWPQPMRSTISQSTPPVPRIPSKITRIAWGIFHKGLYYFSQRYCSWSNIAFDVNILQLPFGLVLKWTDRANLEEAVAMQMARAAGMPVPKLLCCGEHPNAPYNRTFSILMTRLPGVPLENSSYQLEIDAEGSWLEELKTCVHSMRSWYPPEPSSISSPIGTSIRSSRVPGHIMGPFTSEREFHDYLFSPSSHAFESCAEYEQTLLCAKKLQKRSHRIVFTHGDFKAHNILVDDEGHLSGFLDWESAGWYHEYWEFTTAMRFGRDSCWFRVASWIGWDQYLEELDSDVALNLLTVDSYIAF